MADKILFTPAPGSKLRQSSGWEIRYDPQMLCAMRPRHSSTTSLSTLSSEWPIWERTM